MRALLGVGIRVSGYQGIRVSGNLISTEEAFSPWDEVTILGIQNKKTNKRKQTNKQTVHTAESN